MTRITLFLLFIFTFSSCSSSFLDRINPNIVAKVDNDRIKLSEIKKKINKDNEGSDITKPLILFYIKERINEIIIENEFKKLKFTIEDSDRADLDIFSKLNKEELEKIIIFKKVKNYIVRKITPPTEKECMKYYNDHIKDYEQGEQIITKYIVTNDETIANEVYKVTKTSGLDKALKDKNLNYSFKGLIKVENIPDEIKKQINYQKENSTWFLKTSGDYFYIIYIEKYYSKVIPFEQLKEKINRTLLDDKQNKYFKLWLKNQIDNSKVIIFHNKIE